MSRWEPLQLPRPVEVRRDSTAPIAYCERTDLSGPLDGFRVISNRISFASLSKISRGTGAEPAATASLASPMINQLVVNLTALLKYLEDSNNITIKKHKQEPNWQQDGYNRCVLRWVKKISIPPSHLIIFCILHVYMCKVSSDLPLTTGGGGGYKSSDPSTYPGVPHGPHPQKNPPGPFSMSHEPSRGWNITL